MGKMEYGATATNHDRHGCGRLVVCCGNELAQGDLRTAIAMMLRDWSDIKYAALQFDTRPGTALPVNSLNSKGEIR